MFVRLRRGEASQTFSIWVHGDDRLSRGSGLFVGEDGVALNHHFLLPADGTSFALLAGDYTLETFVKLVGSHRSAKLFTVSLHLSDQIAAKLVNAESGVYFDWGPDSQRYQAHVRNHPKVSLSRFLLDAVVSPQQDKPRRATTRKTKNSEIQRKSANPAD
jgi:hypothetical protein